LGAFAGGFAAGDGVRNEFIPICGVGGAEDVVVGTKELPKVDCHGGGNDDTGGSAGFGVKGVKALVSGLEGAITEDSPEDGWVNCDCGGGGGRELAIDIGLTVDSDPNVWGTVPNGGLESGERLASVKVDIF